MSAFELLLIAAVLVHAYVQPQGGKVLLWLALCSALAGVIALVQP